LEVLNCHEFTNFLISIGLAKCSLSREIAMEGRTCSVSFSRRNYEMTAMHSVIRRCPDSTSVSVMGNALTTPGGFASFSDAPAWAEFGRPFRPQLLMSSDLLERLQKASRVTTCRCSLGAIPLLTGEINQRVAPSQLKNFHYVLKGRRSKWRR
jgi:hypothetical protein